MSKGSDDITQWRGATPPADAEAWARAEAEKIWAEWVADCDAFACPTPDMPARIAAALLAARSVPEGMVRVGTTDHPLLGTLPMTADGCVCGMGALPWSPPELTDEPVQADDISINSCQHAGGGLGTANALFYFGIDPAWYPVDRCYSTPAAALAASKENP